MQVVIETPFQLLPRLVLYSALYWWVGLNPSAGAFFFYLLSLAINYCACSAGGYMVGGWTGSVVVRAARSVTMQCIASETFSLPPECRCLRYQALQLLT